MTKRQRPAFKRVYRITTEEGTFDVVPKNTKYPKVSSYYMRKEQADAFDMPALRAAIEQQQWAVAFIPYAEWDNFVTVNKYGIVR